MNYITNKLQSLPEVLILPARTVKSVVNSLQKTPVITLYFRPAGGSIVITVKGGMCMVLLNDGRFHHWDCSIRTVQRMILPELTANRSRWNNRTPLYTTMTHLMSMNLLRAVPHATQFLSQVIYSTHYCSHCV